MKTLRKIPFVLEFFFAWNCFYAILLLTNAPFCNAMTRLKNRIVLLALLGIYLIPLSIFGQGFVRTFGGEYIQSGYGVAELSNGEIVVVGEEIPDPTLTYSELVWFRLSSSGEVLSRKRHIGFGRSSPRKMLALNDDRFIVVGGSDNLTRQDARPYAAEFNPNGEVKWQILLEHLSGDSSISPAGFALDVDTMPGGGFLLTCHATSVFPNYIARSYLVKLSDQGQVLWVEPDSGLGFGVQGQSVIDAEGNIYTALNTAPSFNDTSKILLTKRNEGGGVLWRKVLGNDWGFKKMFAVDMEINSSGDIILGGVGFPESQDYHGIFLKYSANGEKIAENIFQIGGWPEMKIWEIHLNETDEIIAVGGVQRGGDTLSPYGYYDALVVIAGANLKVKREVLHSATSSSFEYFQALVPSESQGYLLVGGARRLPGNVSTEILLAKVNCYGDTLDADISGQSIDLLAYPVPSPGMVTLSADAEAFCLDRLSDLEIEVYNVLGQKIAIDWRFAGGKLVLDFSDKAPGQYYVTFQSGQGDLKTEKILISR